MIVVLFCMAAWYAEEACGNVDEEMAANASHPFIATMLGSSREDVLERLRTQERASCTAQKTISELPAPQPVLPDGRATRIQESHLDKVLRMNQDTYILNARMLGT